ncbi:MAG: hypothetical protein KIS67_28355 [Verrucomicrobiae bacterium]|nr:hypothetical protein [Verrucomicrobiae bacterium]
MNIPSPGMLTVGTDARRAQYLGTLESISSLQVVMRRKAARRPRRFSRPLTLLRYLNL